MNPYIHCFFRFWSRRCIAVWCERLGTRMLGAAFPYHTLTVNIIGSLVMGLVAGNFALKPDPGQHWRLFLTTGIIAISGGIGELPFSCCCNSTLTQK